MKKGSFTEEYQSMDVLSKMLAGALKGDLANLVPESVTVDELASADPLKRSLRRWREIAAEQCRFKSWAKVKKRVEGRIVTSYVPTK